MWPANAILYDEIHYLRRTTRMEVPMAVQCLLSSTSCRLLCLSSLGLVNLGAEFTQPRTVHLVEFMSIFMADSWSSSSAALSEG